VSQYYAGIDPGLSGALVLLYDDGRTPAGVVEWHHLRPTQKRLGHEAWRCRRWHPTTTSRDGGVQTTNYVEQMVRYHYVPSIHEALSWLDVDSMVLAVEGLFQHKRNVIRLAEEAGAAVQACRHLVSNRLDPQGGYRPAPSVWRQHVIGRGPKSRASHKAAAVTYVGHAMPTIPESLRRIDHVCEAACIARYAFKRAQLERP